MVHLMDRDLLSLKLHLHFEVVGTVPLLLAVARPTTMVAAVLVVVVVETSVAAAAEAEPTEAGTTSLTIATLPRAST
jgi:hypothetical protein